MKPETLSVVERQILANQFTILANLNKDDEYLKNDYLQKVDILISGYSGEYDKIFNVYSEEISIEICNETSSILNMYRRINWAIGNLSEDEKEELNLNKIKFEGFDANNDDHYHYAKFMIEKLDKWQEHKEIYLNSHNSYTIEKYRRMLRVNNELLENNRTNFDKEDLKRIIDAV